MTDDAEADVLASAGSASATQATPNPRYRVPTLAAVIVPLVVVADQLTKRWAVSSLSGRPPRHVIWTLQWNLTRNSGMAFSKGQGIGPFIGVVALVIVLWLAWSSRKLTGKLSAIAAGLVAGGAIGNLLDRLFRGDRFLRGAVIDFIDFQWFPIFNIADMAIDIGGGLFLLWTLLAHRKAQLS
ncbi:MAG TPA: signal peptidase II [Ilumatobacteraceae bacterium]|nr:signal peptidase II [Ilumatobacteraceae bacterium]